MPRLTGAACAAGSVALGVVYLLMAGAPLAYPFINGGAFLIGGLMFLLAGRVLPRAPHRVGAIMLAGGALLLATALFGMAVDGATRWVRVGSLVVQPSLVLLPAMIVAFAAARDLLSIVAMVIAGLALAMQPDRAMAGMLAGGMIVLALIRRDRGILVPLAVAVAGFVVTLVRADGLPAARYVEQVLYASWDAGVVPGLAVWGGCVLMIVPAVIGWRYDRERRDTYLLFAAVWLSAIGAAALGNYPTPLVGYGGSAILGYMLSLAALPRVRRI